MNGRDSLVRLCLLYPDLLGTYGDGGNARVLAQRLAWRDVGIDLVSVDAGGTVPDSCDLYLVGGGEDGPQTQAARELQASGALHRAVASGAVVFAVCAGMQILGERFPDMNGVDRTGLGLLDCTTVRVDRPRAVGELLTNDASLVDADGTIRPLGALTGFENHAGRTIVGNSAETLGRVEIGEGNGDGSEGVVNGSVIGTYLHGPALARNPALADELLRRIIGEEALSPLEDADVEALRADRLHAARHHELAPRRSWRDRLRGS
jgi:CobQ-like glutamine amidotransferase family enzyme